MADKLLDIHKGFREKTTFQSFAATIFTDEIHQRNVWLMAELCSTATFKKKPSESLCQK